MSSLTLSLLLVAALIHLGASHFNLKKPAPYNPIDCNRPDCLGPCPPVWSRGFAKARNSPKNPSAVWKRGETVNIEWHRNNHEGGFYRRSLVPVDKMNEKSWHKKLAFEFGCWTQNRYQCIKPGMTKTQRDACGTDKNGFAYQNKMNVPNVFPDGDYVFAMVWYGGIHWKRKRAFFSDYYTCAYVRIQGGAALEAEHTPTFVPGTHHRSDVPKGKCVSTSKFVGECGGEECKKVLPEANVPGEFRSPNKPKKVYLRDLRNEVGNAADVKWAPINQEKKAIEENMKEKKLDDKMANEEAAAATKRMTQKKFSTKNNNVNNNKDSNGNKNSKGDRNTHSNESKKPGCEWMPPAPTGTWGPRESQLWWEQRAKWWKHHNYCQRCGC